MKLPLLLPILLLTPGCCFIGCDEETLLMPDANVQVVAAESGDPISGAKVVVARYADVPHFMGPKQVEAATSSADGQASFERETIVVTQYPLMMHGVVGFAWQLCVEKEGYESRALKWFSEGTVPGADWKTVKDGTAALELRIALPKGDGEPCDELLQKEFDMLEPDAVTDAPLCATAADCTITNLGPSCCPLCYPAVVPKNVAEAREQRCKTTPPECPERDCMEVEHEVEVHCRAGLCRDY